MTTLYKILAISNYPRLSYNNFETENLARTLIWDFIVGGLQSFRNLRGLIGPTYVPTYQIWAKSIDPPRYRSSYYDFKVETLEAVRHLGFDQNWFIIKIPQLSGI